MLIEQRIKWLDIDVISSEADIVGLGDESCIYPFLNINAHWCDFLRVLESDFRIKIILPRVSQNELSEVLNLLQKMIALKRNIEFVLNDWGILFFLTHIDSSVTVHIGRQICRTLLDCPWHDEILQNETQAIRKIISSHPFSDIERLTLLKKNGVQGLEMNAIFSKDLFEFFSEQNMETAADGDSYLLTCGKVCLIRRIMADKPCQNICNNKVDIAMSGKWLNSFEHTKPLSSYEKTLLRGMSISGRKVILPQKIDAKELISCGVDVIITSNKHKVEELRRIQS